MSSLIFENVPGRLVAVKSSNPRGILLSLGGLESTGVLTSFEVQQGVAAQFSPSLDRAAYVTAFGDKIGTARAGLVLNSSCDADEEKGTDQFIEHYIENRLGPDNTQPVRLTVGRKVFTGFVTGFSLAIASESGTLFRGQLEFAAWLAL